MSIRPEWVAKILNGEKTVEVRKRFPKDYAGWIYIYCTKNRSKKEKLVYNNSQKKCFVDDKYEDGELWIDLMENTKGFEHLHSLHGKVVARFWCDRVYEIESSGGGMQYQPKGMSQMEIAKASCLDYQGIHEYLKGKDGLGIRISKLETFEEPREIGVKRPPQSWQWIEIGEES